MSPASGPAGRDPVPASVRSAAHAFVADLGDPVLTPNDAQHFARVLRLRAGERVTLADGRGSWRTALVPPGFPASQLLPDGDIQVEPVPSNELTVGFALTKGDKPELVVQKLTELGIDRIVIFAAEHSVVRWDPDKCARNSVRLATVAREAAMQCRRARLPEVTIMSFRSAASLPGAAMADWGGEPCSLAHPVVLVGPEGGWSEAEREAGLPLVGFCGHVLRAETAAIASGVLLAAARYQRVL